MILPALAALLAGSSANAALIINEATTLFTPSFAGTANSTSFGWNSGGWDGNPDDVSPVDIIQSIPNYSTGLAGVLTQTVPADIVSGSNNIYSSINVINNLGLKLWVPTIGSVGSTGYTTIIIQGNGLAGFGGVDGFGYGAINGILPEYLIGLNAAGKAQWWAKWEIPGNQSFYNVDIVGAQFGASPLVVSVTDMSVHTWYSADGFSPDVAQIPEPSALVLSLAGASLAFRRRRKA